MLVIDATQIDGELVAAKSKLPRKVLEKKAWLNCNLL